MQQIIHSLILYTHCPLYVLIQFKLFMLDQIHRRHCSTKKNGWCASLRKQYIMSEISYLNRAQEIAMSSIWPMQHKKDILRLQGREHIETQGRAEQDRTRHRRATQAQCLHWDACSLSSYAAVFISLLSSAIEFIVTIVNNYLKPCSLHGTWHSKLYSCECNEQADTVVYLCYVVLPINSTA